MAIATTVIFQGGGPAFTINGPAPFDYDLLQRTVSEQSANYDRRTYQLTSKKLRQWPLTFLDLNTAQKEEFVDFFTDDAIGPTNPFTYTHTDGIIYTNVRFANDALSIRRTEPGRFTVSVILEFDDQFIK